MEYHHHHYHHHHHHHKRERPASAQNSDILSKKNKACRSRSITPQSVVHSTSPVVISPVVCDEDNVVLAPEGELPAATPTPAAQQSQGIGSRLSSASHQHTPASHTIKDKVTATGQELQEPKSQEGSRAPSAISSCHAASKSHTPSKSAASSRSQSRQCSSHMSCTSYCSCRTSNCSECMRLEGGDGGSSRAESRGTTCSTAERRANQVRSDLLK